MVEVVVIPYSDAMLVCDTESMLPRMDHLLVLCVSYEYKKLDNSMGPSPNNIHAADFPLEKKKNHPTNKQLWEEVQSELKMSLKKKINWNFRRVVIM